MNLASVLDPHPDDAVAIISRGRQTTYGTLRDQVAHLRGGLVGALTAVVLMMVWVVHDEVQLGALSWGARVVPMTTFGLLLGHGADRLRQGEIRQREHEAAALLHQQAIEINESLVQGLAAARWALEAGRIEHGITLLDQTMTEAQEMVSDLIRRAGIGDRTTG